MILRRSQKNRRPRETGDSFPPLRVLPEEEDEAPLVDLEIFACREGSGPIEGQHEDAGDFFRCGGGLHRGMVDDAGDIEGVWKAAR